jgi:ABC-type lipoprotein export system ATPase subunit
MYKLLNVTKDYRKGRGTVHALQGVDAAIEDGDWLSIQGPTGHGKSTLLQILGALDRPTSGIRAVGFPDLLIAAAAEREHVTVVHYDSDYDHITAITGQPVRWVVPRGTIP